MPGRATIACCLAAVLFPGCAGLGSGNAHVTPEDRARRQQWNESARSAIDRADWDEAQGWLLQLLAELPQSAESHHRLGRVLEAKGETAAAEAEYRRALELEPDSADALLELGQLEARTGRWQAALDHIHLSIEIDPKRADAHLAEGRVLETLGRQEDALAAYFRALAIDSSNSTAMRAAAVVQLDRGQSDQALARLTHVLELTPGDPESLFYRGRAHLSLGHVAEAVGDLRAAGSALMDRADVHYYLALALEQAQKPAEALQAAQRALALAPADAAVQGLSERLRR